MFLASLLPVLGLSSLALAPSLPQGATTPDARDAAVAPDVLAADWPGWRGPDGTGVSPERGWTDVGEEAWRVEVGLGYSQPAVVGARLYTRGFDVEREVDVTVCLDVETGEEVWRHEAPSELLENMHRGGALTSPAVRDGVVYVVSRVGPLLALDAETGEERWGLDLIERYGVEKGAFGLCTSPLLVDDAVVVNVGRTVALDAADGEERWSTEDYGYSYSTPTRFTWRDQDLLAVFNGVGLVVLETATGAERARHEWTSNYNVNCATPIVVDERIFISTGFDDKGCAMLELTPDGLEVLWESKAMRNKMNGCVLVDGYLYGFDDKVLKCIDLDGELRWRERGLGLGTLIASDGRAIVLSEEGELVVAPLGPDGFEPSARSRPLAEGPCWSTPVLAGGRIYVRNQAGVLVCLDHRGA